MSKYRMNFEEPIKRMSNLISNIPIKHYIYLHSCDNLLIKRGEPILKNTTPDYLVLYVETGDCKVSLNNNEVLLTKGGILFSSSGYNISIKATTDYAQVVLIRFGLYETVSKKNISSDEESYYFSFTPGRYTYYDLLFKNILVHKNNNLTPYSELITSTATAHLIGEIYNTQYYRMHNLSNVDKRLFNSKSLIDSNPTATLSVEDLALRLGITPKHYTLIFKQAFGIAPKQYMIKRKMMYAKKLLTEENMNVKDVALKIGYPDQYSFSKQFKKTMGFTPSSLKKL